MPLRSLVCSYSYSITLGAETKNRERKVPPKPPSLAGCWLTLCSETEADSHRDFVQTDVLDGGPDNGQATVLGREDVNLIGALPDVALRDSRWHWWSE